MSVAAANGFGSWRRRMTAQPTVFHELQFRNRDHVPTRSTSLPVGPISRNRPYSKRNCAATVALTVTREPASAFAGGSRSLRRMQVHDATDATADCRQTFEITDLNRVNRMKARGTYDREVIDAILDEALVCHVGIVHDGFPVIIPMAFARDGASVLLHGSRASRLIDAATRAPLCVTVTLLDGLVLARCAYNHSMNYRSAVLYGSAKYLDEPGEKLAALRTLTERLAPGRWQLLRPPTEAEVAATAVIRFSPTSGSAKVRAGGPVDFPQDLDSDVWGGEVPLRLIAGEARPADGVVSTRGLPTTESKR